MLLGKSRAVHEKDTSMTRRIAGPFVFCGEPLQLSRPASGNQFQCQLQLDVPLVAISTLSIDRLVQVDIYVDYLAR